jgi:tRNA A-37 threonylcarbamoyl transferase component Bud32
MRAASDPAHPQALGDYIILRLLGRGGMGTVYEAQERLSRRRVALKVLHHELAQTERGRQQFITEMAILANLDDPHIVRCLHCTEIDGQLVMVLEYLDGRTLRELLVEHGRLSWQTVVRFAWQIAAALHVAHGHRPSIVHRDLKPENVMVLSDGRVKVMDFGIAKILQTMIGTTTSPIGTLQYMSPEQIDAQPLDGRSDLYALGLVMWELLAGRPPFQSESPRILLEKLCAEPVPPLPNEVRSGLPPGLEQLLVLLLEKHPSRRPPSAAEVLARLDGLRLALAAPAGPPVPIQPPAVIQPTATPNRPMPAPLPVQYNTVEIVARAAAQQHAQPPWLVPAVIAGVALVVVGVGALLIGPRFFRAPAPEATNASVVPSGLPVASPTAAACEAQAPRWQGKWRIATEATRANKASWLGATSIYELELDVDGCRLRGSGSKFTNNKLIWTFSATGSVSADGTAELHYAANGRQVEGTWSISPQGAGTWESDAGDVAGRLTASPD